MTKFTLNSSLREIQNNMSGKLLCRNLLNLHVSWGPVHLSMIEFRLVAWATYPGYHEVDMECGPCFKQEVVLVIQRNETSLSHEPSADADPRGTMWLMRKILTLKIKFQGQEKSQI